MVHTSWKSFPLWSLWVKIYSSPSFLLSSDVWLFFFFLPGENSYFPGEILNNPVSLVFVCWTVLNLPEVERSCWPVVWAWKTTKVLHMCVSCMSSFILITIVKMSLHHFHNFWMFFFFFKIHVFLFCGSFWHLRLQSLSWKLYIPGVYMTVSNLILLTVPFFRTFTIYSQSVRPPRLVAPFPTENSKTTRIHIHIFLQIKALVPPAPVFSY